MQFHTRYASHKIPLASLRIGKLLKNLELSGVRIVTSSEQAAALHEGGFTSFDNIIDVSDAETGSIAQISKKAEVSELDQATKDEPIIQCNLADEADEEGTGEDDANSPLANKFVNLTAVLPPLPKKGDFNVETIKKTQYFFS